MNTGIYISNAFSQLNVSALLLNFLMNWTSDVAYALLNAYRHHLTVTFFIFSVFISLPTPSSIYIWSLWFIIINNITTCNGHTCCKSEVSTICLLLVFLEYTIWSSLSSIIFFEYQKDVNNLCRRYLQK